MLKQINKEIQDFQNKQITIIPGFYYNQHETLQDIIFYFNSKFRTGAIDEEGDRKYFYNIVKNPCKVFSKAIDFDTKNIRLLTTGGGDPQKTWFMERDLKFWMRDKQFGKTLNRIFRELPIYGSVVLKIIEGTPYFVDLRNFIVEQGADDLNSSNFIIEIHNYTPAGFRKIAKDMKWDKEKVNEVLEKFYQMKGVSHIRIYERYGDIEDNNEWIYKRVFWADVGIDQFDQRGTLEAEHSGIELSSEKWEGHPYWEFHAEKVSGRWLGIGVVETLIEPQIRSNELVNLQTKTSYWAGLRVFQTRDSAINRNLLTDIRNGEILTVDSEITQIDMSDRNLAFFNEETIKWLKNRDELTFSYDVIQGERLPAGTPLGSAQLAITQTLTYFEGIQENIAMDIKEMLYKIILPKFEEENNIEHTIRLVGQDLDVYISMVKNELVAEEIIRLITRTGRFPTNYDKEVIGIAIEESIKQEKEKILTVPKGYYKDLKYDIDIDITGESVDTRIRAATLFAAIQAMTADPTLIQDPTKRKIFGNWLEQGGINPNDILGVPRKEVEDVVQLQGRAGRAGGGVSAPALQTSIPGRMAQTV